MDYIVLVIVARTSSVFYPSGKDSNIWFRSGREDDSSAAELKQDRRISANSSEIQPNPSWFVCTSQCIILNTK